MGEILDMLNAARTSIGLPPIRSLPALPVARRVSRALAETDNEQKQRRRAAERVTINEPKRKGKGK